MDFIKSPVTKKILRILDGKKPRVLDLFAGCGGISLGFFSSGCEIIGAIENDPPAAKSHSINFHKQISNETKEIYEIPRDIISTDPSHFFSDLGFHRNIESQVDIIVGGPPCQAFARVGRAKLREIAEHPEAHLKDPRGNLYLRYLQYVRELKPIALLLENVPDVLNYGGHNIAEEICEVLTDLGYKTKYTLLNAVYYGVPEMRERMFLLAYRNEFDINQWFPEPTHWINLPKGYHSSRQVALKTLNTPFFKNNGFYVNPPQPSYAHCLPAVTARDALSDLPKITKHLEGKLKRKVQNFNDPVPYKENDNLTDYQILMRTWKHFEADDAIFDHVIRYLPRDYPIFNRMNPGDQYPEAYKHAIQLFNERLSELENSLGKKLSKDKVEYQQLWKKTVPPYDPGKFPNKWRKMEPDKPARTLMAHLGKDGYSHIHYDSSQARTISVREAARLQSFPDGFVFQGPMNPAFRQIGNAVPPLLAKAIAEIMLKQIRRVSVAEKQNCTEKVDCV